MWGKLHEAELTSPGAESCRSSQNPRETTLVPKVSAHTSGLCADGRGEKTGSVFSECQPVSKLASAPAELFAEASRTPRRAARAAGGTQLRAVREEPTFCTWTSSSALMLASGPGPGGDWPPRMPCISQALLKALQLLRREAKLNILCITEHLLMGVDIAECLG